MASVLLASVPLHGHVSPLLEVARHLADRGDDVRFLTGARFAAAIEAAGARPLSLPAQADFDELDLTTIAPDRNRYSGAKSIAYDTEHVFIRPGRAQFFALREALAEQPADALVFEPTFAGGAFLTQLPRGERPPVIVGGVVPLPLGSRDTAPYGMGIAPAGPLVSPIRNRLLHLAASRLVFSPVQKAADDIAVELVGHPLPHPVLDWMRDAEAIVQFTVPEFEYPRSDAPPQLSFVGPVSSSGRQYPVPEWWSELDAGRPVVHVTQGTVANLDWGQLIAPALEALADADVLVAIATGGRPITELPSLPANARAAEYLPYELLMPKTALLLTNGGYGGVHFALRYGVPIVATGGKEDKPEVGARIAWSGVGRRIRSETPKPADIRREVLRVLVDPSFRARSEAMAQRIAAAPGLAGFAAILDGEIGRVPVAG